MSSDDTDPPILEPGYISGVNVVDIGDLRVSRGMTRRPHSSCHHRRLSYDTSERRIWCRDCEKNVDPFDAFVLFTEAYDGQYKFLKNEFSRLEEAKSFQARSLAAKEIDKAWRSRNSVPGCPHCRMPLMPEDFKNGVKTTMGKEYAKALIERKKK